MTVAESVIIYDNQTETAAGYACHTRLGHYYLPKSFIHLHIDMVTTGGKKDFVLTDATTVIRADTRRTYCLDYLASAFADDLINVTRSSGNRSDSQQLLRSVSSSAVDQTAIIIRTLIRTVFTALSATLRVGSDSGTPVTEPVADLVFDPFDQVQTAAVNARIRHLGFCFVLESFTFGQSSADVVQAYCKNPTKVRAKHNPFPARYAEYEATQIPARTGGIFYRPRQTFELSIYAKDDPEGPGDWLLRRTTPVSLENISPVISVKLDRAAFTEKEIALVFVQGDLAQVCIYKKSELVQAALIPLEIVKSIVALPTQMLQIQYDQITQSQALVSAENSILSSQNKLLSLLQNPTSATNPGAPGPAPALPAKPASPVTPTPGSLEGLTRTTIGDYASCNAITSSPNFTVSTAKAN